jgi:adenosylcobinamide-phosphate synthase
MLALSLALAWALDAVFGEPPNRWHPVAWLGRAIGTLGRPLPALRPAAALLVGAMAWALVVGAVAVLAWALQRALLALPAWAGVPLLALALKPAFAWRMLRDEVAAVEAAFDGGVDAARERLARLCSRDLETFDATALRETAIETLAENLNDSVVAPLFWFAVAGLPGAWIWRAVNTMDAMWGYRGRWEWAGKWAARADDLGAWLPARLTAMLLWRPGAGSLRHEAARTPSPNGGWPMAAMALRLGVRLSKPGVYALNDGAAAAGRAHTAQALRAAGRAALAACAAALLVLAVGAPA